MTYEAQVVGSYTQNGSVACENSKSYTIGVPSNTLQVYKSGTGAGTVNSNPAGISCGTGSGCNEAYPSGTSVTLTASHSSGSTFAGWSGACSGTGSCTVNMTSNMSVTATFNAALPGSFVIGSGGCFGWPNPKIENNPNPSSGATSYSLYRRDLSGGGWQTVADHWGIYYIDVYGDPVSQYGQYEYYAEAHNNAGTTRSGNTPYYYAGPSQCGQVLNNLNVDIATGSGTITGAEGAIYCPSTCYASIESPKVIQITATEANGNTFSHWTGACAGQPAACWLTMDQNRSTSAHFGTNNYTLNVTSTGPGTVTGTGGISCNPTCQGSYPYNTTVYLSANPNTGASLSAWSGSCSGSAPTCTVTMNTSRSVGATFATNSYTLTTTVSAGSGSISPISGGGSSCSSSCTQTYSAGTTVILRAYPSAGYGHGNWGGTCSGSTSADCSFVMDQGRSVTATFNAVPFNYSLSNSGTVNVTKASGNAYEVSTITKTLTAGATQSVDLVSVTPVPGVSYSISNKTCSPTCSSVITFTVTPSAPVGTHPITVTGSPLGRTTNFNLVIGGAPFSVSCSVNPASNAILGQSVTWSATASGGVPPLTYSWSGDGIPTSPAPSVNPYTMSYSTIGTKNVAVTITDAESVQSTCPSATIEVTFDPIFEEF